MIAGRRRIGTVVCPRANWNMLDAAVLAWHLEQAPNSEYIDSLFEARMVIEPAAAALAAGRASEVEIEAIAAALRQMSEAQAEIRSRPAGARGRSPHRDADNVAETVAADLRFHLAVLAAAGNLFLASFGAVIGSSLTAAFRLNWRAHETAPELSIAQHEAVLDAIRGRDAATARSCMGSLLESARQDARQALAHALPGKAITPRRTRRPATRKD